MSAREFDTNTKVPEVENTDSGFLSGPIDRLPGDPDPDTDSGLLSGPLGQSSDFDSGLLSGPLVREVKEERGKGKKSSDSGNVKSVTEQNVDLDSGLDLCLSGYIESLRVSEDEKPPTEGADIPPLAFLFQQDDEGDTQLHIASVHGCQKSVSILIKVCPDKYWLDLPNDYGHTPLHLAVMSGHAVVARMLLQAGASLGVRDLRGNTPIHAATKLKHVECLQALLEPLDSRRLCKNLATILNLKNYDGQTCVHLAATAGHLQTLQTLVYYGADINAREGLAGWTALHIAARRGDVRLAQYLLGRCAGVAPAPRDYAGRTPRRLAGKNPAFSTPEGRRLFRPSSNDDSETETESEDEYDSDDSETLFDKIRGSMTTAVATN